MDKFAAVNMRIILFSGIQPWKTRLVTEYIELDKRKMSTYTGIILMSCKFYYCLKVTKMINKAGLIITDLTLKSTEFIKWKSSSR